MKKTVALLLTLLLLFSLTVTVFADNTIYTEGTLHYIVNNESITIVDCFGKDAEVHVPAMIAGIPVNTIASGAFANNSNIQTLYLPDTISKVEYGAIGDWIRVIYNANTDHPQETPTDLILGNMDPVTTPEPTPTPGGSTGSGTDDIIDDDPQTTPVPTATPVPTPVPTPEQPGGNGEDAEDPAVLPDSDVPSGDGQPDVPAVSTEPTPGTATTQQPSTPTPAPSAQPVGQQTQNPGGNDAPETPGIAISEGEVDELDPEETGPSTSPAANDTEDNGQDTDSPVTDITIPDGGSDTPLTADKIPETVTDTETHTALPTWFWIVIGCVVVAAVVLIAVFAGRKKQK